MKNVANYIFTRGIKNVVEKSSNNFSTICNSSRGDIVKICFVGTSISGNVDRRLLEIDFTKKNGRLYTGSKKDFYDVNMKIKRLAFSVYLDTEKFILEDEHCKNLFTIIVGKIHNLQEYKHIFEKIIILIFCNKHKSPIAVEEIEV